MKALLGAFAMGAALLMSGAPRTADEPQSASSDPSTFVEQLAGEWSMVAEARLGPGQEPVGRESGEVRFLGEKWLVTESTGAVGDRTVTSILTLGYDPAQERFARTWIDPMQEHLWLYAGALKDAGTALTLETGRSILGDATRRAQYREVIEVEGANHRVMRSMTFGPEWFESARAEYRRVDPAQAADTAEAVQALAEFEDACGPAEAIWPAELCGPLVLVHPETRLAVANQPDPDERFHSRDGMFVGEWPADMGVANTAMDWGGTMWAVVMLPLPEDAFTRLQLLAHESFHRIQPELGFEISDPMASHLDEEEGRVWLRLEIRALARAVATEDPEAREAVRDALLFRRIRNATFPGSASVERRLEGHEGLAEYTGVRFALDVTGAARAEVARKVEAFEDRTTYVRSLGYGTGPALGLLLDRYEPGWRRDVSPVPNLAQRLALALDTPEADPEAPPRRELAARRALAYGSESVREEEVERAERLATERERYRKELVEGPVLHVELPERRLMFNPNTVLALGDEGHVYPGSILVGPWGRLTLQEGAALAAPDRDRARVAAPETVDPDPDGVVNGPGWVLELEPGWRLVPGPRPGDFRLEPDRQGTA